MRENVYVYTYSKPLGYRQQELPRRDGTMDHPTLRATEVRSLCVCDPPLTSCQRCCPESVNEDTKRPRALCPLAYAANASHCVFAARKLSFPASQVFGTAPCWASRRINWVDLGYTVTALRARRGVDVVRRLEGESHPPLFSHTLQAAGVACLLVLFCWLLPTMGDRP